MITHLRIVPWIATCCVCLPLSAEEPSAVDAQPNWLQAPHLPDVDPPDDEAIQAAITRGVDFLLETQYPNGCWGSPTRTKDLNIYAPVPGAHHAFRAAVTAMCIAALIEVSDGREEVEQAIDRAEAWLFEHLPRVRRANPTAIYNTWTHCYALQALVRMYHRDVDDPDRGERIRSLIEHQYDMLGRYESVDGGWGYYDFRAGTQRPASSSTSFMSAAILVAMKETKQLGIEPPEQLIRRAIASIERQQKPDFTYIYGEYLRQVPMHVINRPGGSLARSQVCNLALRQWGDPEITDQVLTVWLDRLFARHGWLDIGRKRPVPHEAWFAVAGYFYYFGNYYAALCIEELPAEERPRYQAHLAHAMLERQEQDGSWWDFPLYNYHQPYGTAFALMTLKRTRIAD